MLHFFGGVGLTTSLRAHGNQPRPSPARMTGKKRKIAAAPHRIVSELQEEKEAAEPPACLICLEPVHPGALDSSPCGTCGAAMHAACRRTWTLYAAHQAVDCVVCRQDTAFLLTAQALAVLSDKEREHLVLVSSFTLQLHGYQVEILRARWDFDIEWRAHTRRLVRARTWAKTPGMGRDLVVMEAHPRILMLPWVAPSLDSPRADHRPLELPTLAFLPCTRPLPVLRHQVHTVRHLMCPVRAACAPALRRMERLRAQHALHSISYTLYAPNISQAVWWVLGVPRDQDALNDVNPQEKWQEGLPPALAPLFARARRRYPAVAHVAEPHTMFEDKIDFVAKVKGPELRTFEENSEEERYSVMQAVFEKEVSHFNSTCVQPLVCKWRAAAAKLA